MISLARSDDSTTFPALARSAGIAAIVAVPFAMLAFWPTSFNPFLTGKTILFRDLSGFAVLCAAVVFSVSHARLPTLVWLLGLFTVALGLADALAAFPATAIWGEPTRQEGLIGAVALLAYLASVSILVDTDRLWRCLIGAWAVAGTMIAVTGLLQFVENPAVRASGIIGSPVFLGCLTALCGIFALWSASLATSAWERGPFIAAAAVQFAAVFATGTRSAVLGLMVGAVVALWKTRWRLPALLAAALSIGAILWRHGELASSLLYRSHCWATGIKLAAAHPWFGWGQDNMRMLCLPEMWDRSHNVLIQTFSEGGVLAFLSYGAFLVATFIAAVGRRAGFALVVAGAYVVMVMLEPDPITTSLPFLTAVGWLASRGA